MQADRRATSRQVLEDGQQATLCHGRRKLVVRIIEESARGLRVATIQKCKLADGAEITLSIEGGFIDVRVAYTRVAGQRTLIGLERIAERAAHPSPY